MRKRRKFRYDRLIILVIVLIIILVLLFTLFNKKKDTSTYMIDLSTKTVNEVKTYAEQYGLNLNIEYKYNDNIPKDKIVEQSILKDTIINSNDKLNIVVSLGKMTQEKLELDNINELGRVPIMMYHGIINKKNSETNYIGGNVDKDGYNRTVESFKSDLEFYYKNNYRMIRLFDYVNGNIDTEYGKSPIVLTFDDGNSNNLLVKGIDNDGNIIIDDNCAVGVLESFKKKYPDYKVTATFFVNDTLFGQPEYNEKILKWLVDNNYDIGNHTKGHVNFSKINASKSEEAVGYIYNQLDQIIPGKYVNIVALPFGSPYNKTHDNFSHILSSTYNNKVYETVATLRVGWMANYSPFSTDYDKVFIMRVRAYDNNGNDFDITATFKMLEKNRYISDGNNKTITIDKKDENKLISSTYEIITY